MYKKNHRVCYFPQFQASTAGLGEYPPRTRTDYFSELTQISPLHPVLTTATSSGIWSEQRNFRCVITVSSSKYIQMWKDLKDCVLISDTH